MIDESLSPASESSTTDGGTDLGTMSFAVLGSGSSGNSTLIECGSTRVLIDAGLSARETGRRLATIDRTVDHIDFVCVSHEHDDHCRGLEVLTQKAPFAVAATRGTLKRLDKRLGPDTRRIELRAGERTRLGSLELECFRIPHDAVDPIGFRVHGAGVQLGHVTDLGTIDKVVADALDGLDALIIESNHDVDMVRDGPYPLSLKRRLLSSNGHLSNEAVAEFLSVATIDRLKHLYLAHLSKTNNRPELARISAQIVLTSRDSQAEVHIAHAERASPLIKLGSTRRQPSNVRSWRPRSLPRQLSIPYDDWPAQRVKES